MLDTCRRTRSLFMPRTALATRPRPPPRRRSLLVRCPAPTLSSQTCWLAVLCDSLDSLIFRCVPYSHRAWCAGHHWVRACCFRGLRAHALLNSLVFSATRGNGQVTVTFTAPGSNGGDAITGARVMDCCLSSRRTCAQQCPLHLNWSGYTAISSPGGISATLNALTIVVTGLSNGTPCTALCSPACALIRALPVLADTFTVVATNTVGSGAASGASSSVTPGACEGPRRDPCALSALLCSSVSNGAFCSDGSLSCCGQRQCPDFLLACQQRWRYRHE